MCSDILTLHENQRNRFLPSITEILRVDWKKLYSIQRRYASADHLSPAYIIREPEISPSLLCKQ